MVTKKTVSIRPRPGAERSPAPSAEAWVQHRDTALQEPMKRLTIDVPASLHARVKSQCALRGVKMTDEIRALLEKHFPEAAD